MSFYEELLEVLRNDGFVFIVFEGTKGFGKSSAMLDLMYNILSLWTGETGEEVWDLVLRHLVFTANDYWNLRKRDDIIRDDFGRAVVVGWDDIANFMSGYLLLEGGVSVKEYTRFMKDFEMVRKDVAILLGTCATWTKLPKKWREDGEINIRIKMVARGYGYILRLVESKRNPDKFDWELIGKIEFDKIPNEVYQKYDKMKDLAHRAKYELRNFEMRKEAERIAEHLTKEDWENDSLLIGLGIKDIHGNLTDFGLMVRELWEVYRELTENLADDSNAKKAVEMNINRVKIRALLKKNDIEAGDYKIDSFVHDLRLLILELIRMIKSNEIRRISLAELQNIVEEVIN